MSLTTVLRSDDGVTAIEYGLIAALIAVVIIASLTALGQTMSDNLSAIGQAINVI